MLDFSKNMEKIQKSVEEASKSHYVPLNILLNDLFMLNYTTFDNIDTFIDSGFGDKYATFQDIPIEELNEYVRENTKFENWDTMLQVASNEYMRNRLRNAIKNS